MVRRKMKEEEKGKNQTNKHGTNGKWDKKNLVIFQEPQFYNYFFSS